MEDAIYYRTGLHLSGFTAIAVRRGSYTENLLLNLDLSSLELKPPEPREKSEWSTS